MLGNDRKRQHSSEVSLNLSRKRILVGNKSCTCDTGKVTYVLIQRCRLTCTGIPIMKIRGSHDRFSLMIIPSKTLLYWYGALINLRKNKSNIRHTWSTIKEIISKKRNKKDFPSYFKLPEKHISDPMAIANHFNKIFANIGPKMSKNLRSNSDKSVSFCMAQTILSSFNFACVNSDIVGKTILELSSKNTSGADGLSTNLLKRIFKSIAPPLYVIINQSLVTGFFPDRLKIAKVFPLFKKEDYHMFDNNRPISLLSSISKVVEKIVFIQVYDYFSKQKLLYDGQYGFQKKPLYWACRRWIGRQNPPVLG